MKIVNCKFNKAFTLLELLIVIGLIATLAAGLFYLLDPLKQIGRARDAQRKNDINKIQKVMEDWYNDKGCYPKPAEICKTSPINICSGLGNQQRIVASQICQICGNTGPSGAALAFTSHLPTIPCDPQYPKRFYLYQTEMTNTVPNCGQGGSSCSALNCGQNFCPQWYRLYADLESGGGTDGGYDADSKALGCLGGGCGLPAQSPPITPGAYGFDYGASSPNNNIELSNSFHCFVPNTGGCDTCDVCDPGSATYQQCLAKSNYERCVSSCANADKIYPSYGQCAAAR